MRVLCCFEELAPKGSYLSGAYVMPALVSPRGYLRLRLRRREIPKKFVCKTSFQRFELPATAGNDTFKSDLANIKRIQKFNCASLAETGSNRGSNPASDSRPLAGAEWTWAGQKMLIVV